jgi:hypothetical protein
VKFNKECLHIGYKSGTVDPYLSAQLFAAPAAGQNSQKLAGMNKTGRFKKINIEGKQLLILKSIIKETKKIGMKPTWMQNTILVKDFKEKSGQKEDQKISQEDFPTLLQVEQLIIFFRINTMI